jgi:hypothetical protein
MWSRLRDVFAYLAVVGVDFHVSPKQQHIRESCSVVYRTCGLGQCYVHIQEKPLRLSKADTASTGSIEIGKTVGITSFERTDKGARPVRILHYDLCRAPIVRGLLELVLYYRLHGEMTARTH